MVVPGFQHGIKQQEENRHCDPLTPFIYSFIHSFIHFVIFTGHLPPASFLLGEATPTKKQITNKYPCPH